MKLVAFFKILVVIMSTLIVAGFALIFGKIADNYQQRKSKTTETAVDIKTPVADKSDSRNNQRSVLFAFGCATDACLVVQTSEGAVLLRINESGQEMMRYQITDF